MVIYLLVKYYFIKKMKDSPFNYGGIVSDQTFTNRENEIAQLKGNLLNGINTTIISPRRWGKSSLVEKVIKEIEKEEKLNKIVLIDLYSVNSEEEFLESFAKNVIKASSNKWEEWMSSGKEFFSRLIPKLSIGVNPEVDFSLSFNWNDLKRNRDEILNLPEAIAEKKGIKFIICLDEFQNLASFNQYDNFEKELRSYWQRHKSATYCFFGSKRHMMTNIFNNPSKPFYRFGDTILLQKIETNKWIPFITNGFIRTGKQINENYSRLIPKLMKNHPWYVQQFAHYVWNLTDKNVTQKEINTALTELLNANSPFYQKEIETISLTQLNLLKAVLKGETQFTSSTIMQKYFLGTPNNVSKNKIILTNNDMINQENGIFEFVDPAFELWFRNQYFNESYLLS